MVGRDQTCCFTGHRPEKLPWGSNERDRDCVELKRRLAEALENFYQKGYRHFICGMAKGADLYFAEAVLDLREKHAGVSLEAAVPCPTQTRSWSPADKARHAAILERCDLETMVQQHYDRYCMLRRNRYMVGRSSALLAVYDGMGGGTMYTISCAMDQGLEIVRLEPRRSG